jgi:hypothetical protein
MFSSLFSSRLTYGILVWFSANSSDLKQLQTLQNKALRNLFQHDRMERTKVIHTENNVLTIKQQAHHQLANHIHNIKHNYIISTTTLRTNDQYHSYNTRQAMHIHTEHPNTNRFGVKQVLRNASQIYNSILGDMKILNKEKFKLASKNHFKSKFDI